MKILVLTTRLPYPPIGGDKLTVYNLLKELKKTGHEITLITLYNSKEDLLLAKNNNKFYTKLIPVKLNSKLAYVNAALGVFNKNPFIMNYFYSKKMQKVVDSEIKNNNYDTILCHLIRTSEYVKKYDKVPKVLFMADAMSFAYKRRLDVNKGLYDKFKIGIECNRVLEYEKKIIDKFDTSILHSEFDKNFLAQYTNVEKVRVIPHGVDKDYFYFNKENIDKNKIVFVGNMRTIANSDAAIYFGENIFPLIKEKNRYAKFVIIGAEPRAELFEMASKSEGIEITGVVEDIREHLKTAVASVCPVRIAAGIQNKILESMSMGVPVVTTPEGAQGIYASLNELLIANSDEDMANMVLELMNNSYKRELFAKNARKFIEKNYSWQNAAKALNDIIQCKQK